MEIEINDTANQVSQAASGKWLGLWHGAAVVTRAGQLVEFDTEEAAWAFLAQCDAHGGPSELI